MGALIGFILGYSLGVKAGPEGYEKLRRAWQDISSSEEFKGLVATGTAMVENLLSQARTNIAGEIEAMTAQDGGMQKALQAVAGNGELMDAWNRISNSDQFRSLLSNGIAIVGGALEQGAALLTEQLAEAQRPERRA